jgi:enamine deaminase RidA (YjgF/YER057c/UK114 family)
MAGTVEKKLQSLGVALPRPVAPVANYVPFVKTGALVFVSGQIPLEDGHVRYRGQVGGALSLEDGYRSARLCAINLLAQLKAACDGDLDRVKRVVRLGGFVCCAADFADHPKVINGASDLMVEAFGDRGRHTRTSVGCASLPIDSATEVEGVFEIG